MIISNVLHIFYTILEKSKKVFKNNFWDEAEKLFLY